MITTRAGRKANDAFSSARRRARHVWTVSGPCVGRGPLKFPLGLSWESSARLGGARQPREGGAGTTRTTVRLQLVEPGVRGLTELQKATWQPGERHWLKADTRRILGREVRKITVPTHCRRCLCLALAFGLLAFAARALAALLLRRRGWS